jgi:hypothetical protein
VHTLGSFPFMNILHHLSFSLKMGMIRRVGEELSRRVKGHGKGGIETKEGLRVTALQILNRILT